MTGVLCVRNPAVHATLACFFIFAAFLLFAGTAHAAITEQAPPIDAFFENAPTIGGGAIMPLVQFRLMQSSGSDTLDKVGVLIHSSTTPNNLTTGEISRLSLWK